MRRLSVLCLALGILALLVVIDLTKTPIFGLSVGFEGMIVWGSFAWLGGVIFAVLAFVAGLKSYQRSAARRTTIPMLLMLFSAALLLVVILFGFP